MSSSVWVACCYSPADDNFLRNPTTTSWADVPYPPWLTWPFTAMVAMLDARPYNFHEEYMLA